jgi:tetratricopeptide (TPR) repeat protein
MKESRKLKVESRKSFVLWAFVLGTLCAQAQTQSGVVRTVSRPDAPSQRLQGVVVRVQGEYNPVMTDEQGAFQVLMPGQKNGSPYALAGVNKGGYELREPEIVGRQLPFSSSVPLEIIMVSRRQLQRDKQRIEQAARENIEQYYEQQLNKLNEQLAQAQLSNQEYEKQLSDLESEYDRFEPLIEQMAERYARTDYEGMSAADSLIQQAIEQGDLQLAQQRILAKGDPAEREKKMKRIRRLADAQRDELAEDYYHLYAIHLSRFENDSARYYILKRAELDTTNAQWQIDAGDYYDKMSLDYDKALVLYQRALRYAIANEGAQSLRAAQAHNNIAYALYKLKRYDEALAEQRIATDIYLQLLGKNHQKTAERLTNMGAIHFYIGRLDSAQFYFSQAEQVYTALSGQPDADKTLPLVHADLLENQAAIYAAQKDYDAAYAHLQRAMRMIPEEGEDQRYIKLRTSLGTVCHYLNRPDEARSYWQQALERAQRLYGEDHPTTQKLKKYLQ